MDWQSEIIALLLLFVSINGGACMENFECKARSGCHFTGCDPAPIWLSSALNRNEFPITCQPTSDKSQSAKVPDQRTLANERALQQLTRKVESLEKSRDQTQKEIKRMADESAATLKRLLQLEKRLEQMEPRGSFEATKPATSAKPPTCNGVPDNKNCYSKDSDYLLCFHCDFQTIGYPCGMINTLTNDVNWIQNFGNLSKSFSGATIPSIQNTDGYLIVGAAPTSLRSVNSYIMTPDLAPGSYCIQTKLFMSPEGQYKFQLRAVWVNSYDFTDSSYLRTVYSYEFTSINWMIIRQNVVSPHGAKVIAIGYDARRTGTSPPFQPAIIIDDISITKGRCPRLECAKVITPPTTRTMERIVPDTKNCKSDDSDYVTCFHCDFQTVGDPCGMININSNVVNWIQNFGNLSKSFSGATIPSIQNTDGYLFVGAAPTSRTGAYSEIMTPDLAPGSYCIQTKLFMSPEGQYKFQLRAVWMNSYDFTDSSYLRTVYSYEFTSINWMIIRQNFASPDRAKFITIGYEARRTGTSTPFQPAIIIDDINITQGRC